MDQRLTPSLHVRYQATPGPKEICWLDASQSGTTDYAELGGNPDAFLSFAERSIEVPTGTEVERG